MEELPLPIVRHYFPGNNTPQGFFSYYRYILEQREANRLICLKGGPGTGKSTFLKKVGFQLEQAGEEVDYLHCSADEHSLDGILLPKQKIAFVDGTSPHIIDPITPGAVDYIINFGDFWNDKSIAEEKEKIITYNETSSYWYRVAYHYLEAAKAILNNLAMIQEAGIEVSEIYKLAADIIGREYRQYDISLKSGRLKKFFATGITPAGNVNYIKTLLKPAKRIYLISVPEGYPNTSFMQVLMEGALYRGFDVEAFYCPMNPAVKVEHMVIPELEIAFATINKWHDIEPWEISDEEGTEKDIILLDINDYQSVYFAEKNASTVDRLSRYYRLLIDEGIRALSKAKENHDLVEQLYLKNMDFDKVDQLVDKTVEEIMKKEGC